jgi:hypothetical protein
MILLILDNVRSSQPSRSSSVRSNLKEIAGEDSGLETMDDFTTDGEKSNAEDEIDTFITEGRKSRSNSIRSTKVTIQLEKRFTP